ncbi:MAG: MFS transporter [Planctomycetota bacterium]
MSQTDPSVSPHPTGAAPTPPRHVPLRVRIGWGMGGIADNFMANTLFVLGMLIYVTCFKMPAGLAGLALSIPRFVDAISDPLIGNLSDNLRTRFGRRRPMMFVGVIGTAVLLPLMWFPPFLDTAGNPWHSNGPFWWLAIVGSLYFLFYTLFMVPYTALGFELTDDYDERTRVLAWRMYLGLLASMTLPALYWLCRLEVFGEGVAGEIHGVRWVSAGLAVVILITGLSPVLFTRERASAQQQEATPILRAVRQTLSNRPFLILFTAYIAVIMGLFTASTIGTFALIYYVFQDAVSIDAAKDRAAVLGMIAGLMTALMSYGSMYLAAWVSRKTGKRIAMMLGLSLMLTGAVSALVLYNPASAINQTGFWFNREFVNLAGALGITLDPQSIRAGVLLAALITGLGGQGCWLMIDAMTADICDEDELLTGKRREGLYGAAQGFGRKIAFAITVLCGGYLLDWIGFDPEAAEQAGSVSAEVADRILFSTVACQGIGLAIAIVVFAFYPLTRARAHATQQALALRAETLSQSDPSD